MNKGDVLCISLQSTLWYLYTKTNWRNLEATLQPSQWSSRLGREIQDQISYNCDIYL